MDKRNYLIPLAIGVPSILIPNVCNFQPQIYSIYCECVRKENQNSLEEKILNRFSPSESIRLTSNVTASGTSSNIYPSRSFSSSASPTPSAEFEG